LSLSRYPCGKAPWIYRPGCFFYGIIGKANTLFFKIGQKGLQKKEEGQ